jgi:hypothetical protein
MTIVDAAAWPLGDQTAFAVQRVLPDSFPLAPRSAAGLYGHNLLVGSMVPPLTASALVCPQRSGSGDG